MGADVRGRCSFLNRRPHRMGIRMPGSSNCHLTSILPAPIIIDMVRIASRLPFHLAPESEEHTNETGD
jgi:hypothetical protein